MGAVGGRAELAKDLDFQKRERGQFCKMIVSNIIRESIATYVDAS